MILRISNGEFKSGDTSYLLDFLGVKKEASGVQSNQRFAVAADVELIASVPFTINNEQLTMNNEKGTGNNEQLTKSNEEKKESFAWTLSTFDLDRFGERIDPLGWDYKAFMKNPIVEWAHRYDIPAIGKIETLACDEKGLHGVVVFNGKEYDPFGWSIGERVKNGVIRAGSVGFRILEIEIPSKEDSKDGTTLIFRKQELLEFSICNVPANPFALAKYIEAEKTDKKQELNQPNFWGGLINI
jgi:uncharacterized protein